MSTLVEKVYVRCALNQAPAYLERFFKMHSQGDPAKVVVLLHAPLAIAGFKTDLEKPVEFSMEQLHTGNDMIPEIRLRWEPEGGGPFPVFAGTLTVQADEDYSSCAIVLRGSYEPPGGAAGKAFDATMGSHIAHGTARELLERIRDFIESAYDETERDKKAGVKP